MSIKKNYLLFYIVVFIFIPAIIVNKVNAAYLYFDPVENNINLNQTLDVAIKINTESEAAITTDAVILFDSTSLSLIDIVEPEANDKFFPRLVKKISSNKAIVGGAIEPNTTPKSGIGTLAVLKFKSKIEGDNLVTFSCSQGLNSDSNIHLKKNGKAIDIIDCEKINQSRIAVSFQAQTTPSYPGGPTPVIIPSAIPTVRTTIIPTTRPIISPTPSNTPTPTLTPTINLTQFPQATPATGSGAITVIVTTTFTPTPSEMLRGGLFTPTLSIAIMGISLIGISLFIKMFLHI